MIAPQTLLVVENLSITSPNPNANTHLIERINFKLQQGETLAIVGESGSGKTLTALSILQLLSSNLSANVTGNIHYYKNELSKVDLLQLTQKELYKIRGKEIAMIFQDPMSSLNPVYTCGNQVLETIQKHQKLNYKTAKQKTLELFEQVKLPDVERIFNSYPHQISGGQKQRVMIAMALSCEPNILLADEPTTALDVSTQQSIIELLQQIQKERNIGIIFISHDLNSVSKIAHQIMVMYQGKMVEQGLVHEVLKNPQQAYTKGLLACRPKTQVRLKKLPTIQNYIETREEFIFTEKIITTTEREKQLEAIYQNPILIDLQTVSHQYQNSKQQKALNDISLQIYKGETLGILGESGSGKSTLGRAIIKLINPTSGTILFKNQNIQSLKKSKLNEFRKKVQLVFQDPYSSLNPRYTIGECILEPMLFHKIEPSKNLAIKKTNEFLSKVGLPSSTYNKYPHELSGGQRQRVCIARALTTKPEFLICDECVSALDVSVQAQILNLLLDLKSEFNLTYLFISHDLAVVKFISDRIALMQKGSIIEINEADSLFYKPKMAYTQMLVSHVN